MTATKAAVKLKKKHKPAKSKQRPEIMRGVDRDSLATADIRNEPKSMHNGVYLKKPTANKSIAYMSPPSATTKENSLANRKTSLQQTISNQGETIMTHKMPRYRNSV